jgi:hypothetical protein
MWVWLCDCCVCCTICCPYVVCVGVCVSTAVPQVLVSHHHLCLFIDSLAALDRALPLVTIHRITASPVLFIEKSVIFWVCVPWFLSISAFHFFSLPHSSFATIQAAFNLLPCQGPTSSVVFMSQESARVANTRK